MKLTLTYPDLDAQRELVGAPMSDWGFSEAGLDPRESLLADLIAGIEIDLSDVSVGPGRLLTFKGEQVILYIKDTRSSLWILQNEPENSRRFHVAECRTLEKMRAAGRFERYVVTNRTDGIFRVDWLDPDTAERGETDASLKVCKDCLNALNWRNYDSFGERHEKQKYGKKKEIWNKFVIVDFLLEYSTFFVSIPSRRDFEAKLNRYVENWSNISQRRRSECNWTCSACGVALLDHPEVFHCHHVNGVVTDNSRENLKVLCAMCHAQQPQHQHMIIPPDARQLILSSRARQGLISR